MYKRQGYNQIQEEIEEVEENVLRRDDQERISESERVFRNGEYGRDCRQNQGEYTKQFGGTDGIHQGISQSDLRSDEAGLSFTERGAEPIRDVSGFIQGEETDQSFDRHSETGDKMCIRDRNYPGYDEYLIEKEGEIGHNTHAVSYTHLDVYKRQYLSLIR